MLDCSRIILEDDLLILFSLVDLAYVAMTLRVGTEYLLLLWLSVRGLESLRYLEARVLNVLSILIRLTM